MIYYLLLLVGTSGIEPLTFATSKQRSTTELRAFALAANSPTIFHRALFQAPLPRELSVQAQIYLLQYISF